MKNLIYSLFFLSLFTGSSQGIAATNALRETAGGPDTAPSVLNLDAGLMLFESTSAPGINIGVAKRVSSTAPLYLGGELGTYFSTGAASYAVIPVLASFYYQFEPTAAVHPIIGVLAGPVFATGGGYSAVRAGMFLRPGINLEVGRQAVINFEARLGVIGSSSVFLPMVGAIFAL